MDAFYNVKHSTIFCRHCGSQKKKNR